MCFVWLLDLHLLCSCGSFGCRLHLLCLVNMRNAFFFLFFYFHENDFRVFFSASQARWDEFKHHSKVLRLQI